MGLASVDLAVEFSAAWSSKCWSGLPTSASISFMRDICFGTQFMWPCFVPLVKHAVTELRFLASRFVCSSGMSRPLRVRASTRCRVSTGSDKSEKGFGNFYVRWKHPWSDQIKVHTIVSQCTHRHCTHHVELVKAHPKSLLREHHQKWSPGQCHNKPYPLQTTGATRGAMTRHRTLVSLCLVWCEPVGRPSQGSSEHELAIRSQAWAGQLAHLVHVEVFQQSVTTSIRRPPASCGCHCVGVWEKLKTKN